MYDDNIVAMISSYFRSTKYHVINVKIKSKSIPSQQIYAKNNSYSPNFKRRMCTGKNIEGE